MPFCKRLSVNIINAFHINIDITKNIGPLN